MSIAEKLTQIAENEQKVYEAGQQSEYDKFWDSFQSSGSRGNYTYAFSLSAWNDTTYKPKYKPKPTKASYMFYTTRIANAKIDADFSAATDMSYAFTGAYYVKHIGVVDTRSSPSSITQLFAYCRALHTIDKLFLLNDGSQTFSNAFLENNSLKNIVIEGVIGNSISFQHSPLTKESITSIINALSDTSTGKTATFKQTAINAAFTTDEWEALKATKPNWAFAYA